MMARAAQNMEFRQGLRIMTFINPIENGTSLKCFGIQSHLFRIILLWLNGVWTTYKMSRVCVCVFVLVILVAQLVKSWKNRVCTPGICAALITIL